MTFPMADPARPCISVDFGGHSALGIVQLVGAVLIPLIGMFAIAAISHRYPTTTLRWTGPRIAGVLGARTTRWAATAVLGIGLVAFALGIIWPIRSADVSCSGGLGLLSAAGLLSTLAGSVVLGFAWAHAKQAGWVVLATLFVLDVWIVFGMLLMHIAGSPNAPDALLTLAFLMHGVCMYLTTSWSFHARNASTIGQIRAGEAGRSIGAVWVFLAAYVVMGFFYNEQGLFASTAGGAVVSALTLSALALTMGGGYTRFREVMHDEAPEVLDSPGRDD